MGCKTERDCVAPAAGEAWKFRREEKRAKATGTVVK
jgi:hypothetical protein